MPDSHRCWFFPMCQVKFGPKPHMGNVKRHYSIHHNFKTLIKRRGPRKTAAEKAQSQRLRVLRQNWRDRLSRFINHGSHRILNKVPSKSVNVGCFL
jgi:hypothetical protein